MRALTTMAGGRLRMKIWCRKSGAVGLRRTVKYTGLDRKTIRAIVSGEPVKMSTLAKIVIGLRAHQANRKSGDS
jgi:hypothetical protein